MQENLKSLNFYLKISSFISILQLTPMEARPLFGGCTTHQVKPSERLTPQELQNNKFISLVLFLTPTGKNIIHIKKADIFSFLKRTMLHFYNIRFLIDRCKSTKEIAHIQIGINVPSVIFDLLIMKPKYASIIP